jgi:hypothetical protein
MNERGVDMWGRSVSRRTLNTAHNTTIYLGRPQGHDPTIQPYSLYLNL